jgi:hypothetical protein
MTAFVSAALSGAPPAGIKEKEGIVKIAACRRFELFAHVGQGVRAVRPSMFTD